MADFSALKTAIQANIRTNGNEEITGAILQDILLSMVSTMGDGAINALAEALQTEITNRQNAVSGEATTRAEADSQLSGRINAEATARGEADTQLNNSITAIITRLNEGYVYAGIATPSTNPGTPAGKVFYIALQAGTYTNFSNLAVTQGINILKYNGTAWSQEQLVGIDDEPTTGSNKLVKSGGVYPTKLLAENNYDKIEVVTGDVYDAGDYKVETVNIVSGKYWAKTNDTQINRNSYAGASYGQIEVVPGTILSIYTRMGGNDVGYAFVTKFNGDNVALCNEIVMMSGSSEKNVSGIVVPEGAKYLVINLNPSWGSITVKKKSISEKISNIESTIASNKSSADTALENLDLNVFKLNKVKEDIQSVSEYEIVNYSLEQDKFWRVNPSYNDRIERQGYTGPAYTIIDVNPGDIVSIFTRMNGSDVGYAFVKQVINVNNMVCSSIVMMGGSSTIDVSGIVVPDDAIKLMVNVNPEFQQSIVIKTKKISKTIADLESAVAQMQENNEPIPSYYTQYMAQKIKSVNDTMAFKNGCGFLFATDFHFPANTLTSKPLIKAILDKTTIPFALFGGDYPGAYGTESECKESGYILASYTGYIGKDRVFGIRGNHDFTIKTSENINEGFTAPEKWTYNILTRNSERYADGGQSGRMYYYIDNPVDKVRIIMLNSDDGQSESTTHPWGVYAAISQGQVDWLLDEALNVENYKIIFVSHIPADSSLSSYDSSQDVLHAIAKAVRNKTNFSYSSGGIIASKDFTNTTNTFVCHLSGHNHKDESNIDDNVLSITTTCNAAYSDDGHGTVIGTISEQAFDVFCIDFEERTIKAIRIGRGNDRNWTF